MVLNSEWYIGIPTYIYENKEYIIISKMPVYYQCHFTSSLFENNYNNMEEGFLINTYYGFTGMEIAKQNLKM